MVGQRCFVQRHAHPPNYAPQDLAAVFGLIGRPAATALTTRATLIVPRSSSTWTSTNTAEWVAVGERLAPGAGLGVDLHFEFTIGGARHDVRQGPAMAARVQVGPSVKTICCRGVLANRGYKVRAYSSTLVRRTSQAWHTAEPTDDTVNEPP